MAGYTGDWEEDSERDPEEVGGIDYSQQLTANCSVTKQGVLIINGQFAGSVFFRGTASRECSRCRRIKPNNLFTAGLADCKKCRRELSFADRIDSWQDSGDHVPPDGGWAPDELVAQPLDQMMEGSKWGGTAAQAYQRARTERLQTACASLAELTE